jgi:hypothetical protein
VEIAAELLSADSTVIDYLWYTDWRDGFNALKRQCWRRKRRACSFAHARDLPLALMLRANELVEQVSRAS